MESRSVLQTLNRVEPILVIKQTLPYIDMLFNLCLKINDMDGINYSPLIKLAFYNKCNHYLDRLFVVEETESMVIMVKNVSTGTEAGVYKRSAYIIMKKALKFVHFDKGYIFSDLFEYCHIEPEETSKHLYYRYQDRNYRTIEEISSIDKDYKTKTKILYLQNNNEVPNDINLYIKYLGNEIIFKVGYYIPDESIKFFHVMMHLPSRFGELENPITVFESILADPNNLKVLINTVLLDLNPTGQKIGVKSKKIKSNQPKNKYLGMSLVSQLFKESDSLQLKRIFIGWFMCEVLFSFFFR